MPLEDWTDPETARAWDADQTTHNPTRAEQLDIMLTIIEDHYKQGKRILDVGIGSGIVEEMLFRRVPGAYVVGVDMSEAMVALAHNRLKPYVAQYEIALHDLRDIALFTLPAGEYQIAFSVQVIHNVADEYKRRIFEWIYGVLEEGGLFLLLDRMAVQSPTLFGAYKSAWDRLDRAEGTRMREGSTFEQHTSIVRDRGDQPAGLEEHLQWLRACGFDVAVLHLHANRALIVCRKGTASGE